MDIVYDNNVVRRTCEKAKGRLKQRLDDIRAAESLAVLQMLPGHFHALRADRAGDWACDLDQPYRLVFKPLGNPLPVSEDGRLDAAKVQAVLLLEVVDYHGR